MKDIHFNTRFGEKSAIKAANHEIEGFLHKVYFKEDVLKKYESNKKFRVDDDGCIHCGDNWSLYRGTYRRGEFISVNLGDLGENLPYEELKHWKEYNISYDEFMLNKKETNFRDNIKRMIHFMELSNSKFEKYLEKYFFDVKVVNKNLFNLNKLEHTLNNLKKVINEDTSLDDFQARIIFLNILIIESMNEELMYEILMNIDENLVYSNFNIAIKEIHSQYISTKIPEKLKRQLCKFQYKKLKSLELLRKLILVLNIWNSKITDLDIKDLKLLNSKKEEINKLIKKEFESYYKNEIYALDYNNSNNINENLDFIRDKTDFLKVLKNFRDETAAHGFSQSKFKKILKRMKLNDSESNFLKIYEKIILSVGIDIESIYFILLPRQPPIKEYWDEYIQKILVDITPTNKDTKFLFEELSYYLEDFPDLYDKVIDEIEKKYFENKDDIDFVEEILVFIELLCPYMKDVVQDKVYLIIDNISNNRHLQIARISYIIHFSDEIRDDFYDKSFSLFVEGLSSDDSNISHTSKFGLEKLIEKCPSRIDKNQVIFFYKKSKLESDIIENFIEN